MPVELRKRKAPQPPPAPAPAAKKTGKVGRPAKAKKPEPAAKKEDDKKAVASAPAPAAAAVASKKVAVGDVIDIDAFGGEIQTNDGETTTLKKLLEESGSGVVLFTYPKASTPGCKSFLSLCFVFERQKRYNCRAGLWS